MRRYLFSHLKFNQSWSNTLSRDVCIRHDAIGVLLYDSITDQVVLIEQIRTGCLESKSPWLFELVAGIWDEGFTAEQIAIKEAKEEAGCIVDDLIPMMTYCSSPGSSSEQFVLFCGKVSVNNVAEFGGLADEDEDIRVHIVSYQTAQDWLNAGLIVSAPTIISLQWLQLNYDKVRAAWA